MFKMEKQKAYKSKNNEKTDEPVAQPGQSTAFCAEHLGRR